jgi:hypothetical protein
MNFVKVKEALRKIMVDAAQINPLKDLRLQGMVFEPKGNKLWVEEFTAGGETNSLTNKRSSCNAFIVQYNFNLPSGTPIDKAESAACTFLEAIPDGTQIPCGGDIDCVVQSTKYTVSEGKLVTSVMVAATLFVSAVDKNSISEKQ